MGPQLNKRTGLWLMVVGAVLVLGGIVGGFVFAEDGDGTAEPNATSSADTSTTTTDEPSRETAADLYALLERAFADDDDATLLARLDPAVLETYGDAQCRAYLEGLAPPGPTFEVVGVGEPAPWDYGERDGRQILVEDAIAVDLLVTNPGAEPTAQVAHVRYDGSELRWFTDCGEPLAA